MEFSWKWSNAETDPQPVIRFSIEAIGDDCGTLNDPYNKVASFSLINRLKPRFSNTDYHLFDHLSAALLPEIHRDVATGALAMHGPKSTIFLGFEFVDKAPLVKAYLLSSVKAVRLGISAIALVCKPLNSLATKFPAFHTLHVLANYFQTAGQEFQLEPVIVAVKCVCPRDSRIKVYARTAHTTFDSVEAIMSSFEPSHSICRGIEELRTPWQLMMGPMTEFSSTQQLLPESQCTFGILYYFEVTANSPKIAPKIVPKIYLPVKHYGQTDHKVAQGLGAFLSSRDKSQVPYVSRYLEALQQICTYRNLNSQCGLQAYISCSIKDNSINVTSYLSPEIYHHGRGSAMATWQ